MHQKLRSFILKYEPLITVNGEQKKEIAELTIESFKGLGIRELLTMQRQVGFASLIERIIHCSLNDFPDKKISKEKFPDK